MTPSVTFIMSQDSIGSTLMPVFLCNYVNRSSSGKDYTSTVAAYYEFLRTANEWLSHRATDVCIFFSPF